ncbi:septum formation initiator family protein [candidate division WWE3 bacterium]|uniref:Septum formation initiator family protein n=1 Tax=candidate division WWE3 bacterium TaxID=2053526 RepID=A0A7X9E6B3_UNCKA|nr:septum formation initiator family protein [candidate division WWE3 bacterium]
MSKVTKFKYMLGTLILFIVSISLIKSSFQVFKSKNRLDVIKREVAELEMEKEQLEQDIKYKQTEEYIEEKARNNLNLVKPGEKVYVVVGEDVKSSSSSNVLSGSDEREEKNKKDENWYSWYKLFF